MIKNDHEYLTLAMRSYENHSCITVDEFMKDLNLYISIKKNLKKYISDFTILRKLVNQVLVFYNCFGKSTDKLLFYKIQDDELLSILVPILAYLNIPYEIEKIIILNINVIQQLEAL